jgi:hypothetical protein
MVVASSTACLSRSRSDWVQDSSQIHRWLASSRSAPRSPLLISRPSFVRARSVSDRDGRYCELVSVQLVKLKNAWPGTVPQSWRSAPAGRRPYRTSCEVGVGVLALEGDVVIIARVPCPFGAAVCDLPSPDLYAALTRNRGDIFLGPRLI